MEMAFLSEGVKSPCPRGVLKILVFDLGVKNCKFLSEGGGSRKGVRGGNIFGKMSEGGNNPVLCPFLARGLK